MTQATQGREATKYGKLIGRLDDEFYILDEIFKHSDDFQGATATVLRPVSREEYEEATTEEALVERFEEYWRDAVANGHTTDSLETYARNIWDIDGDDSLWDPSGSEYHDQVRALGYSVEEYPVIECTGGGRSFTHQGARDQAFDEVYSPELLAKIQAVEK